MLTPLISNIVTPVSTQLLPDLNHIRRNVVLPPPTLPKLLAATTLVPSPEILILWAISQSAILPIEPVTVLPYQGTCVPPDPSYA